MLLDFAIFALVGFVAQVVDGALGMAYGVVSTTVLLAVGVSPAYASASVHAAEMFTTAASATSHVAHRNVDWKLFWRLAPAGVAGGCLGAYVLTSFDGDVLRPWVTAYLALMGIYILVRAIRPRRSRLAETAAVVAPLGVVGGFVDAAGGGGWGPVVTASLVGSGAPPRFVIGTVNTVEFFLTTAISAAFLVALLSGHWNEAEGLLDHLAAVAGLVTGGLLAAPLAGFLVKKIPTKTLMILVGVLVSALATYQTWQLLT